MSDDVIVTMGSPILYQQAVAITDFSDPQLTLHIDNMRRIKDQKFGVGIAANQIGVDKALCIVGFTGECPRYPSKPAVEEMVLINPEFEPIGDEMVEDWEGCLSIPGMRGLVPRYNCIRYHGYDEQGNELCGELSGFAARIFQHECDHLNGKLYFMRITDLKNFGFEENLQQQMQEI